MMKVMEITRFTSMPIIRAASRILGRGAHGPADLGPLHQPE